MRRSRTILWSICTTAALLSLWAVPPAVQAGPESEIVNATSKPLEINLQYGDNQTRDIMRLPINEPVKVETRYRQFGSRPCMLVPTLNVLANERRSVYSLSCETTQACHHIREPRLRWLLRMTAEDAGTLTIEQEGKVINELPCR